ncbi:hypothetical protein [Sorangium sp. So ce381]|uniref:hypothetical protein n=1 Tax=Sorangium sp. So ce381 TaxID=3133307 RepID=UPI003F5B46D4
MRSAEPRSTAHERRTRRTRCAQCPQAAGDGGARAADGGARAARALALRAHAAAVAPAPARRIVISGEQ